MTLYFFMVFSLFSSLLLIFILSFGRFNLYKWKYVGIGSFFADLFTEEENKRLLDKVNQTQTIKTALEKNGVRLDDVKKYEDELIRLHQELQENNLKIERLKGKVKND